ncbi:hypothetical protein K5X82_00160 [Halosquirtibacter xylanolyticus]|uniref:condensin complex protein MksE n=1 Tax=Halosquirtibacter xylanolyticus TaxID=3374599 RepID=UPI003747AE79|nr:hypothetical protein K5X82_00160 [Prolixibacteraceae bacterium]
MENNNLKQTIFERLSRGAFVCSNSASREQQRLFRYIDEHYSELYDYYEQIGYRLTQGDEYYYFTRNESKADLQRKIEKAFRWIDYIDFFKTYDSAFTVGYRFAPEDIAVKLKVNASLKTKLKQLQKSLKESIEMDTIKKLIDELRKDGYIEMENEVSNTYKVLSSFYYLESLILNINLSEDVTDEISQ